jgi:hypothetical protein
MTGDEYMTVSGSVVGLTVVFIFSFLFYVSTAKQNVYVLFALFCIFAWRI